MKKIITFLIVEIILFTFCFNAMLNYRDSLRDKKVIVLAAAKTQPKPKATPTPKPKPTPRYPNVIEEMPALYVSAMDELEMIVDKEVEEKAKQYARK